MPKQISKYGVKLDLDPILRRRALSVSQSHTPSRCPIDESSSRDIPSLKFLERRGNLQGLLREIMSRFSQADQKRRDAIDREVMNCFAIARYLTRDDPIYPRYHSRKWEIFWKKNSQNPTKALKFVFNEAHADPKKASFYFRSTCSMFEENVKLDDLPRLVTKAGGYERLARQNRRYPRIKKTEVGSDRTKVLDYLPHEQFVSSVPNGASIRTKNGKGDQHTGPLLFTATVERGGNQFSELSAGSYARIHLQVIEVAQDKITVKIFHVSNVQKPRHD